MRQNEINSPTLEQSTKMLCESLRVTHPADITSGARALLTFVSEQMLIDYPVYVLTQRDAYPKLCEAGQQILAGNATDFRLCLADYLNLLSAVANFVVTGFAAPGSEVSEETQSVLDSLERIARNLGVRDVYMPGSLSELTIDPVEKHFSEKSTIELMRCLNKRRSTIELMRRLTETLNGDTGTPSLTIDLMRCLTEKLQSDAVTSSLPGQAAIHPVVH